MTPHQAVVRWPEPKLREARKLYYLGYTVPDISKKVGIPAPTLTGRIYRERWNEVRDSAVIDFQAEAEAVLRGSMYTLVQSIRVASKLLKRVEGCLETTTPCSPVKTATGPMQQKLHPLRAPMVAKNDTLPQEIKPQQAKLSPKDLATLASALKDSSEVLLRVFSK